MTLLLTGFDAFGDCSVNPSALVAEAVSAQRGGAVVARVLPTSYARAGCEVEQLMLTIRPSAALLLGLYGKAECVLLERIARNRDHSQVVDNDGERRLDQVIVPGGPDQYSGTLPWGLLHDRARRLGVAADDSDDAGGFVCNHVYYRAAHCVSEHELTTRVGFVHVPECADPAELDCITRCICGFVDVLSPPELDQPDL